MSDFASEARFDQGVFYSTAPAFISIPDMFHISQGTFEEFKMEGYVAPTTAIPLSAEHKIPTDKNRDIFAEITKKSKDPGPSHYSETFKSTEKRYWTPSNGRFSKGRRRTMTEEVMDTSKKIPGPSDYNETPKSGGKKRTAALGKFK
jgi:hypothetical protein